MKIPHLEMPLGGIMQMAWITPDLDRSLEQFCALYGVSEFYINEPRFAARAFGEDGELHLRFALANIDNMQIELIQPLGGIDRIYREVLPKGNSHSNVFHHICIKIEGSITEWEEHVAALRPHQSIVLQGDIGPDARFLYTDERAALGIYVEHVWFGQEMSAHMAASVPTYRTR